MASGDFWMTVMDRTGAESSAKRYRCRSRALLFGTAAIALAAILTPIAADRTSSVPDRVVSGSVRQHYHRFDSDRLQQPGLHCAEIDTAGCARFSVHHTGSTAARRETAEHSQRAIANKTWNHELKPMLSRFLPDERGAQALHAA
jgi:hypothetical protein